MGVLVVLAGMVIFVVSFLGVVNPGWSFFDSRLSALGMMIVGFIVFVVGGSFVPVPDIDVDKGSLDDTVKVKDNKKAVSYSIIEDSHGGHDKRVVVVLLSDRCDLARLREIADKVKQGGDAPNTLNTYVSFLLDDGYWLKDAGDWAQVNYLLGDDVRVKINGLSAAEYLKLVNLGQGADGDVIGAWVNDAPLMGALYVLFRDESGVLWLDVRYVSDVAKHHLIKIARLEPVALGRRLVESDENGLGEYFLIADDDGDLEFFSRDSGHYDTAKSVRRVGR